MFRRIEESPTARPQERISIRVSEDFSRKGLLIRPLFEEERRSRRAFFQKYPYRYGRRWFILDRSICKFVCDSPLTHELFESLHPMWIYPICRDPGLFRAKNRPRMRTDLPVGERNGVFRRSAMKSGISLPTAIKDLRLPYLAPVLPLFDRRSGGNRFFQLLRLLRRHEVQVTLAYDRVRPTLPAEPYLEALDSIGIRHAADAEQFRERVPTDDFNVCVIGWYKCAQKYGPIVRQICLRPKS